jgi:hypothetical protein
VYGPGGALRIAFGREGEGPGELRSPRTVAILGDTVIVGGDGLLARVRDELDVEALVRYRLGR